MSAGPSSAAATQATSPDYSIVSSLDSLDRTRQIALRVKTASSASSSPAAAAATSATIDVDLNSTTFCLPRTQAMLLLGLVNKTLKPAGSGDLVELQLGGERNITLRGVRLCIEFLGIHASCTFPQIPKPLKLPLKDYLQGSDRDFVYGTLIENNGTVNQENDALFETLVAATALDFKQLVDLCSAALAQLLTGKTVAEMRGLLGVDCDYTEEEEKEISEANKKMFPEEARRF